MRLIVALLAIIGALFATTAIAQKEATAPAPAATVTPVPPVTPDNVWVLDLSNGGRVTVQLRPDKAPDHVARIKLLSRAGFYNGLLFHRVIDGFMAQGGDPKGTGEGGSTLPDLKAEVQRSAACARRAVDGARGIGRQRQQPVLHHPAADAAAGQSLHRLRPRDRRDDVPST